MGELILMPGVERRDLAGPVLPGEQVLRAAIELGIEDVVIVGRHRDGSRYVSGTFNDLDKVVGVLMDGANMLMAGSIAIVSPMTSEPEEPA